MSVPRDNHAATLLGDGRVLITGGVSGGDKGSPVEKTSEIYDVHTGTWTFADQASTARYNHAAIVLTDGRVFVTGGFNISAFHIAQKSSETYEPAADRWRNADNMHTPRAGHLAFVLNDGRVLAAGGFTQPPNVLNATATAEIYDPAVDRWSDAEDMIAVRGGIGRGAVILLDGRVLAAGGLDQNIPRASSEIYDPSTGRRRSRFDRNAIVGRDLYSLRSCRIPLTNFSLPPCDGWRTFV